MSEGTTEATTMVPLNQTAPWDRSSMARDDTDRLYGTCFWLKKEFPARAQEHIMVSPSDPSPIHGLMTCNCLGVRRVTQPESLRVQALYNMPGTPVWPAGAPRPSQLAKSWCLYKTGVTVNANLHEGLSEVPVPLMREALTVWKRRGVGPLKRCTR